MLIRHAARGLAVTGLAAAALGAALLGPALPAPSLPRALGQEGDEDASYRAEIGQLFDRWNDAAPADRIAAAVQLCERRLKEKSTDVQARLDLARLKLAKEDFQGAEIEARKAEADAVGSTDRANQARALEVLAFREGANRSLATVPATEREKKIDEFKKKMLELDQKLIAGAGSKEAAQRTYQEEHEHVLTASLLNELGHAPRALDKKDLEGKPLKLDALKGKVVLVDFWATWCRPCVGELPNVVKVFETYKDRGLTIVGISLDQDRAKLDAFLKEKGISWPQYFDGKGWQNDVAKAWGVTSIPKTYLIDHTGKVRYVDARGEGLAAAVKELVERAEKAGGSPAPKKGD